MKTALETPAVTLNETSRLYVIPSSHGGWSCLGFDVLNSRCVHLARELAAKGFDIPAPAAVGSLERYAQYVHFCDIGRKLNAETGWRSSAELTPCLTGLERKRVEVSSSFGTERFYVGRSTGWMPCHLAIKRKDSTRKDSTGGGAVCLGDNPQVRVIR